MSFTPTEYGVLRSIAPAPNVMGSIAKKALQLDAERTLVDLRDAYQSLTPTDILDVKDVLKECAESCR